MTKKAVCVGINNYPGSNNDLNGCVNDANDWSDLLRDVYQFEEVQTILDGQATRRKMLGSLTQLITDATPGRRSRFHLFRTRFVGIRPG